MVWFIASATARYVKILAKACLLSTNLHKFIAISPYFLPCYNLYTYIYYINHCSKILQRKKFHLHAFLVPFDMLQYSSTFHLCFSLYHTFPCKTTYWTTHLPFHRHHSHNCLQLCLLNYVQAIAVQMQDFLY